MIEEVIVFHVCSSQHMASVS